MHLAVISDTHGDLEQTRIAVKMLASLDVDRILHCGDIGTKAIVELFAPWPTDFVMGNCDWDRSMLASAIQEAGQTFHGHFGDLEIEGKRIALLHSDNRQKFHDVLHSNAWDLVCYGHSHVAAIDRFGPLQNPPHSSTLALNPGAIHRANPPSLAIIEMPSLEATIIKLS